MCGIAGMIDLTQQRTAPGEVVRGMARALVHRGPDEDGFFFQRINTIGRRLSVLRCAPQAQRQRRFGRLYLKASLGNPVSEVALPSKSVQQCRSKS